MVSANDSMKRTVTIFEFNPLTPLTRKSDRALPRKR